MSGVRPWDIYHVPYGNGVKPKFFLSLYYEDEIEYGTCVRKWFGFYINTNPQRLDTRKKCDVPISPRSYGFLAHDSHINVGAIVCFPESQLDQFRDNLRQGTRDSVCQAVQGCDVLEGKYVQRVLQLRESEKQAAGQLPS